jgi:hypothetical protein
VEGHQPLLGFLVLGIPKTPKVDLTVPGCEVVDPESLLVFALGTSWILGVGYCRESEISID